ncbi:GNAT family N-acetyltransferase [Streptomyces sp. NBC_00347]|uniref:GNAT family N-acetyltransferase n=1 Tax=Streptomyces sp. NBC_00347 TaxID=2975721 RepID=UPI00224CAFE3|nr:GNAT family N-acetyltransferase [Streptomyces sp. NBC_00347]MCX5124824.1 GNAT family N-acetyltransferase [Streptomyces sp. NBC_00347]
MAVEPLLTRARGLWELLAAAPVSFPSSGELSVVASPGSQLSPPSWTGIVVLGDAAIVTAPTTAAAQLLRRALTALPVGSLTDPEALRSVLSVAEVLGPATLGYMSKADLRPVPFDESIEELAPGHPALLGLAQSVGQQDAEESAIDEITSSAFVVRADGHVVAAAGYRAWPATTAHISVLTAVRHRGRGLARQVAYATVAQALAKGLLPQWRARPQESRRVARALGFRELGSQLSVQLDLDGAAGDTRG